MTNALDFSHDMTFAEADAALLAAGVKQSYSISRESWHHCHGGESDDRRDISNTIYFLGVGNLYQRRTLRDAVAAAVASLVPSQDDAALCAFAGVVSLKTA